MTVDMTAPLLAGQMIGSPADSFVIAEWRDPGGTSEKPRLIAPRHIHHRDDEAWYVLEGTLHIEVGDRIVEAHTGSAVFVPRGTPHTYWNPGPGPTRYLLVMAANICKLIAEIHAMTDRSRPEPGSVVPKV